MLNLEIKFIVRGQEVVSLDLFAQTIAQEILASIRNELDHKLSKQNSFNVQAGPDPGGHVVPSFLQNSFWFTSAENHLVPASNNVRRSLARSDGG